MYLKAVKEKFLKRKTESVHAHARKAETMRVRETLHFFTLNESEKEKVNKTPRD